MNISFLISQIRDNGSIQTLTHKIAEYFSIDNNVFVISISKSILTKPHHYKVFDLNSGTNKIKQVFYLFKLKRFIKKQKIDVLICEHTSFLYNYIKLICKIKIVWVDHGSLWWRHRLIEGKMNTLWREKRIIKHSDKIISLTNDNVEAYRLFFPKYSNKVSVIPNFVSVDLPKNAYNFSSKSIVTVGRCDTGKDYGTTIECFDKATVNNQDWHLYIYAGGPLFNDIQQLIVNKKIESRVHLIQGEIPINIYSNKSFFIMNSWHEGSPLVLLEAMKCGLPLISYNCHSGPSELIKEGENGFLIKLGDSETYINKINYLINNQKLSDAMSKKSLEFSKDWSFENSMSKWRKILESFISSK